MLYFWCILVVIGYLISFLVVLFGVSLGAASVRFCLWV